MFSSLNYKLLALSIALLAVGYILLGQGPVTNPLSISVAPVVLVVVYLFLVPLAIIVKGKEEKGK
jgi:hypothetical protein